MDRQHKAGACKANSFNVGPSLYGSNTQEDEEDTPKEKEQGTVRIVAKAERKPREPQITK